MTPELVLDARVALGEGPLWDPARGILWWVDILAGRVHGFDPATATDRVIDVDTEVGCLAPMPDGRLLVGVTEAVAALEPVTGRLDPIVGFPPSTPRLRCNDGKCDPMGRFWVGRMAFDEAAGVGTLVRLDAERSPTPILGELTCPNGLGWTADGRTMVFIDSPTRTVMRYPFDPTTGALGTGTPCLRLDAVEVPPTAVPDGLTIDAEDRLWVAVWGGGCVLRVGLDGDVLDRVDLPVSQPTSCTFGGPELTDLYITSARQGLGPDVLAREPFAGGLFRVRTTVHGRLADAFAA